VMFGLFDSGINASAAQAAGYTVVQNATQLAGLNLNVEHHVSGQFTEDTVPPLKVMALAALDILEDSPEGFFVMIEQEETDTANHSNNMSRMLAGAVEFHDTVKAVLAWAAGRDDTLIVVGTDHETGGLEVHEAHPTAGAIPEHSYATTGHTGADVRFFAGGVGASRLGGHIDNTDVFPMLAGYHATSCVKGQPCYASTLDVALHEGSPNTASAAGDTLEADFEPGLQDQSLLRFGNLADYLPQGCTFQAAKLVLHGTRDSAQGVRLHRMLTGWSEDSTWSSFGGNGVQANDIEAAAAVDAESDSFIVGINTLDVTSSVAAWLADPSSNFGWLVMGQGNDDAQFGSSEATLAPELRVYCD
ncbi:MAG TPA: alkaline phosphatase, partial [Polyangiaceae bacterium]|nr:alkaline phosphatase [Polyangiaceae bacterium]